MLVRQSGGCVSWFLNFRLKRDIVPCDATAFLMDALLIKNKQYCKLSNQNRFKCLTSNKHSERHTYKHLHLQTKMAAGHWRIKEVSSMRWTRGYVSYRQWVNSRDGVKVSRILLMSSMPSGTSLHISYDLHSTRFIASNSTKSQAARDQDV